MRFVSGACHQPPPSLLSSVFIDSEDLPKTLSEIDIQLAERKRPSSVSVESLGLYRSRALTMDRDRSDSANSCNLDIPVPEEGPAVKEVDPVALRSSANC
jgi:hypothetical protein